MSCELNDLLNKFFIELYNNSKNIDNDFIDVIESNFWELLA